MMRTLRIALSLCLIALAACGEPDAPDRGPGAAATPDGQAYVADGTVLDDGEQVVLCLGVVLQSLPPQCSGLPITNWSWDDVADEETAADTTWGSYRVTGTYDDEVFTVTEPPGPHEVHDDDPTDFSAPCDEPEGGWSAPDPSKASDDAREETMRAARREPDFAEAWIDYLEEPSAEADALDGNVILVMAFTGDLDRHETEVRSTWGGPLCLVQHERSYAELKEIQRGLGDLGYDTLYSDIDVIDNVVEVGVVLATPELLQALEGRYGPGTVEVHSALRPVE